MMPNELRFSCRALLRPSPTKSTEDTRRRPKRLGPGQLQTRVMPLPRTIVWAHELTI